MARCPHRGCRSPLVAGCWLLLVLTFQTPATLGQRWSAQQPQPQKQQRQQQQQQQQQQRQNAPSWWPPYCRNSTLSYPVEFMGKERSITAGDVTYAYHRFGPTATRNSSTPATNGTAPLLLIMGYTGSMYNWPIPFLQALSKDREVVIFDNMGVGNSTLPRAFQGTNSTVGFTIELMANSTVNFVKALNFTRKPDLIGYSMGGFIGLTVAARHSAAISKAVILSSRASGPQLTGPPDGVSSKDELLVALGLDDMFTAGDPGVCVTLATIASFPEVDAGKAVPPRAKQLQGAAIEAYVCNSTTNYDLLPAVKNRVMFLHGMQDVVIPVNSAVASAARVPGAWLAVLADGASHGLPYQFPQKASKIVLDFFDLTDPMTDEDAAFADFGVRYNCTD